MISSKLFRANHPSRVRIALRSAEGEHSGLLSDSVIMTDNLATILDTGLNRVIGYLPIAKVDEALRHTLGL
jgi:mRNA interferase MazF